MIVWDLVIEMPPLQQFSRINIIELQARIVKKIGHERAEKYFYYLQKFLSLKISKHEFNKRCLSAIGRENVGLHNQFIISILKNASLSKTAPLRVTKEAGSSNAKTANVYPRNFQSPSGDIFPPSPRKFRSANIRRDHPSPLKPNGKSQGVMYDELISSPTENARKFSTSSDLKGIQGQRSVLEVISIGSKAPVEVASVEDGEEVEQAAGSPCIQSRSPVRPPFGIPVGVGGARKSLHNSVASPFHPSISMSDIPETCCSSSVLPDTKTLRKRLEKRLEIEGLNVSIDCINLLSNGLDAFLKRLIRPCIGVARARYSHSHTMVNCKMTNGISSRLPGKYVQESSQCFSASMLDFRVAMELNPQLLGEVWPVQLEKICLRSTEEWSIGPSS